VTSHSRVDVWLIDLERDGTAFARMAELAPAESRRFQSLSQPADAVAFAASRAGLRQVLQRLGLAAGTHLHRTRSGQPFVLGQPAISVSHTRSHIAIAAHQGGPVGVDIEVIDRTVPEHALISRVSGLLGAGWPLSHLSIAAWTVVEAWTKLYGLTLAELLDSPGRGHELEAAIESSTSDVRLVSLRLPAGLVGACWFEGREASITVHDLEPEGEVAASH
jgi:phosphopantetheinyl transferase